ncbi:MAG: bifunctional UDP-N-acetylglucosamine diphosphorylase/glucosamine-1-phosphate N-acetyltransferase GlmU [Pseudomonadales bacterium]|nr:bifunctional UDP-N-acetylglucosamine diphosphorylase/glucosamine-1-phosphate N-acetyltransferase GlmU [Pseudomonadales bacterium]
MTLDVVILAAGQGTRMRSSLPKVLHPIAGKPMLAHVLDTARLLTPSGMHVVVQPGADQVRRALAGDITWVEQREQLGTAHAVAQAMPGIGDDATVLVLFGDVPLVNPQTIRQCVDHAEAGHLSLVTAILRDPAELGRIVREDGAIRRIVEYKDASTEQRGIREINSGIMAAPSSLLSAFFATMRNDNAQGEFYLTDIVEFALCNGVRVEGVVTDNEMEVAGVNNRVQLAEVERAKQREIAEALMRGGVTLADPARLDVRGNVRAGRDVFIDVNAVLIGEVELGDGVSIGPNVMITDSKLGAGVRVNANSVIEGAVLSAQCTIGPFARIRPGTELAENVHIGNFVETKKARIGKGSKANHLAYLGDTDIGAGCNIGAGTITCNYDGFAKHRTSIGDDVFVGSNATLVAPVELDDGAFVAAGSTITTKVENGDLAVGRGKQRNIKGWTPPHRRQAK